MSLSAHKGAGVSKKLCFLGGGVSNKHAEIRIILTYRSSGSCVARFCACEKWGRFRLGSKVEGLGMRVQGPARYCLTAMRDNLLTQIAIYCLTAMRYVLRTQSGVASPHIVFTQ